MALSQAQKVADFFDQKVRPIGLLVANGQFSGRMRQNLKKFSEQLREMGVTVVESNDSGRSDDYTTEFSGFHFWSIEGSPYSFIEALDFTLNCYLEKFGRFSAVGGDFAVGRRIYPVVYNVTHLRRRLGERLSGGKKTPQQKLLALPHRDILGFCLFYLEAAEKGLLAAPDGTRVGIPTADGILIGEFRRDAIVLPEKWQPLVFFRTSRIPFEPIPLTTYEPQIFLNTFIDYDSLGPVKERAAEILHKMNNNEDLHMIMAWLGRKYLGCRLDILKEAHPSFLVRSVADGPSEQKDIERLLKVMFSDEYVAVLKDLSELAKTVSIDLAPAPPTYVKGSKMAPAI